MKASSAAFRVVFPVAPLLLAALCVLAPGPGWPLWALEKGQTEEDPKAEKGKQPEDPAKAAEEAAKVPAKAAKVPVSFDELRARFEQEKALEGFERTGTIERFASVPSKKAAEFLAKLYAEEANSGICVIVTHTLGRMGSEDAVKALIHSGIPYFLDPPHPPNFTVEQVNGLKADMAIQIDSVGMALSNRLEPKAEEWLVKNGLTPAVRKDPKATEILLKAIARLRTPLRIPLLLGEVSKTTSPGLQVTILEGLRRQQVEGGDDRVANAAIHFVKSQNTEVLAAAYDLLAARPSPKHRSHFIAGLKHPYWEVRVICADALQASENKDLVKHLSPLLKDPDSRVQVTAVQAFLRRGGAEVIEPLFRALETAQGRVLDDISDTLARLTGKNFGPIATQWESWWAQNKGSSRSYTAMSPEEFAALKEEDKNQATQATPLYFGLRVLSGRVAFLLDCSESMNEEYVPRKREPDAKGEDAKDKGRTVVVKPEKKAAASTPEGKGQKGQVKRKKKSLVTRISVAKRELKDVIQRFKDTHRIDILRFNSLSTDFVATAFPDEGRTLPQLTPKVREAANAFVEQSKAEGLTDLLKVLRRVLEYSEVDTVYLLSDGAPTVGVVNHADLLEEVTRLNRHRKVKINAISFDPKPDERKLLQTLADRNFGVYVER